MLSHTNRCIHSHNHTTHFTAGVSQIYLHDATASARRIRVGSQMTEKAQHRIVAYRPIVFAAMLVSSDQQTFVTTLWCPPGGGHLIVVQRRANGKLAAHFVGIVVDSVLCGCFVVVVFVASKDKTQSYTNKHTKNKRWKIRRNWFGSCVCVLCDGWVNVGGSSHHTGRTMRSRLIETEIERK